jgi:hypothetical protein
MTSTIPKRKTRFVGFINVIEAMPVNSLISNKGHADLISALRHQITHPVFYFILAD